MFSELLAPTQTQIVDGICLRHYSETEIYTAVICEDKGIYPFENLYVLINSQLHDLGNINQYRDLFESQSDSDGSNNSFLISSGNGNCLEKVAIPAGTVMVYRDSSLAEDNSLTETILETSLTQTKTKIESNLTTQTGGISINVLTVRITTSFFEVINDLLYLIRSEDSEEIISTVGQSSPRVSKTESVTSYTPHLLQGPAFEVCDQSSWQNPSTTMRVTGNITSARGSITPFDTSNVLGESIVEVNFGPKELITVGAGTFNAQEVNENIWFHEDFVNLFITDGNRELISLSLP